MTTTRQESDPETRQGDLWAWTVSFVVTTGLHVGIVLFITLAIALGIYALASTFANVSWGVRTVAWVFTVISLTTWGMLVKQQTRGFRPHAIRGLGKIIVTTSGCERGEIAADIGIGLIGLAQVVPLLTSVLTGGPVPERIKVITALVGSLFVALGWGSLILRLWLCRQGRKSTSLEQAL